MLDGVGGCGREYDEIFILNRVVELHAAGAHGVLNEGQPPSSSKGPLTIDFEECRIRTPERRHYGGE
jgi:hypothetical protein